MRGDVHVRFCEGGGVRFPPATRLLIVCPRHPHREMSWLTRLMERLGLTLHPEKTRMVHIRQAWVAFLGYCIRRRSSGQVALDIAPKAMLRIRDRLRETTRRTYLTLKDLIVELNAYIRGAGAYFRLAQPRSLWNLDRFVLARIARWARHKHVRRLPVWSLARGGPLYREHGLATWWRRKQQPAGAPAWAAREVGRTAVCGKAARTVGGGGAGRTTMRGY